MNGFPPSRRDAEEDSEEDEDEEEEDEEEEDEEDEEEGKGPSEGSELTRAARRELKKKQAAEKTGANEDGDGDDGDLMVNPNHVAKKLNISDLSAPRELTRRERYVPVPVSYTPSPFVLTTPYILCAGSRRRRKRPRSAIGR